MLLRVDVTQDDIAAGKRGANCACPVALAIERVLPGSRPWVRAQHVAFSTQGYPPAVLPRPARAFIRAFDAAGPASVRPFAFTLNMHRTARARIGDAV